MHTNSCPPLPSSPPQHRRQQQELLKLQQQQALQHSQQAQSKLSGWGSVPKQPVITKSLLEIQREEAQQMKQRKEQQQPQHPVVTPQIRTQTRTVRDLYDTASYWLDESWVVPLSWVWILVDSALKEILTFEILSYTYMIYL